MKLQMNFTVSVQIETKEDDKELHLKVLKHLKPQLEYAAGAAVVSSLVHLGGENSASLDNIFNHGTVIEDEYCLNIDGAFTSETF